ncbi:hypothetical protein HanIR_Chr06g0258881 [Helianthus annuus]|nr:hypothetical protein HanIR_Chr06g0258881 [Helianthus annuus]
MFHISQNFCFTFCSKFCELTRRNVRVWFIVFMFCFTLCSNTCKSTNVMCVCGSMFLCCLFFSRLIDSS